jgi:hypothetical protein
MPEIKIDFTAPPTVARFMKSEAFGRLIAGPVGSGKTTGCIFELFRRACEQERAPIDNLRHTRFAIVRQTLRQLKDTVLKDVLQQLEGLAEFKVSESTIHLRVDDIRSEWLLMPLEDPIDQRRLLSTQLTGAWMQEATEMDVGLIPPLSARVGRFPNGHYGTASWQGIICDTNMPSEGSEWHKFMEDAREGVIPDWQIFIQPSGLSDQAENLAHLNQTPETKKLPVDHPIRLARGREYYERAARNRGPDWIKRFVHAQYGDDPSGTAVFREVFKSSFHVVDGLQPVHGHPILIGQDFGRDPCSLICQHDHRGRLLVLEEAIAEDTGLELHISQNLRPRLSDQRYLGKPIAMVGDPAGRQRSTIYEESTFDALKRFGFMAFAAPTNDIDTRLRAVEAILQKQVDGGPALLIDRAKCPTLVRALNGGYRYSKTRMGMRKPTPDKNEYSHIADALQYVCLCIHGGLHVRIGMQLRGRTVTSDRPRVSSLGWT